MNSIIKLKIKEMYRSMVGNSKKRGHLPPKICLTEFESWVRSQKRFHNIVANWEDSNYNSYLAPSIDRINEKSGYSFDNIQLLTWAENINSSFIDRAKKILVYDKNGDFISEFQNKRSASFFTKDPPLIISQNCRNDNALSNNGFQYKYKSGNKKVTQYINNRVKPTSVLKISKKGNIVASFESITTALKTFDNIDTSRTTVISQKLGTLKVFKGFYWCREEEFDAFTEMFEKHKESKKLLQYSTDGDFIKEFKNLKEAEKVVGGSLNTTSVLSRGFQWKYKNSDKIMTPYVSELILKQVHQYSSEGKFIQTFDSVRDVYEKLGFKINYVRRVILGERGRNTYKGFKWYYEHPVF